MLESELFGHVKGAFTGAVDNKIGRFEAAHGGTIFLDEIASMSPNCRSSCCACSQEGEFERVGDSRTIHVDTRVVAATNQYLEDEIEAGRFREDLYYRLNVVPVYLPPLRERRDDIPTLARFFLERHSELNRRPLPEMTPAFQRILTEHDWPGNVRELENYLARAVVLSEGKPLVPELISPPAGCSALEDAAAAQQRRPARSDPATGSCRHPDPAGRGPQRSHCRRRGARADRAGYGRVRWHPGHGRERLGINRNTLHKKVNDFQKQDRAAAGPEGDRAAE